MVLDSSYLKTSPFKPDIFNGKVVFVTGGAGSICRVQTEALVLLGANACIIGRRKEHTEKVAAEIASIRPGAKVLGLGDVDVRDVSSLEAASKKAYEQLGRIDFVIAGAAGNFLADFGSLSARAFKSVIDIDLLGSFNTAKALYPYLAKSKGKLLFVSATLHYSSLPLQSHASAAKAGVDALAKVLALELGPSGITVNCIAPGPIDGTEGLDRLLTEDLRQRAIELSAVQRLGVPRDIADSTVFLFSDAAGYITGTVLVVDGGAWHLASNPSLVMNKELYPGLFAKMANTAISKL